MDYASVLARAKCLQQYLNRAKLNYQFTKELSLRLILDYNATIANMSLVDLQTNLGSFDGGPSRRPSSSPRTCCSLTCCIPERLFTLVTTMATPTSHCIRGLRLL
jgi:hypothetical protein